MWSFCWINTRIMCTTNIYIDCFTNHHPPPKSAQEMLSPTSAIEYLFYLFVICYSSKKCKRFVVVATSLWAIFRFIISTLQYYFILYPSQTFYKSITLKLNSTLVARLSKPITYVSHKCLIMYIMNSRQTENNQYLCRLTVSRIRTHAIIP